jgi:hypothetical protein
MRKLRLLLLLLICFFILIVGSTFLQKYIDSREEAEKTAILNEMIEKNNLDKATTLNLFSLEPTWNWSSDNPELVRFVKFAESHPDCLNFTFDSKTCYGSERYLDAEKGEHNSRLLWLYFLDNFDIVTIESYYKLFKSAVDVYGDIFILFPITQNGAATYENSINSLSANLLKSLVNDFIEWNEKSELYIDLQNLEPVVELSINSASVDEYLKSLVAPSNRLYLDEPSSEYAFWQDRNLADFEKYVETLPLRHNEMWTAMHDSALREEAVNWAQSYLKGYDSGKWDEEILSAIQLSAILHYNPLYSCGPIRDEALIDLKSLGFTSAEAYYSQSGVGHTSTAPWVSRNFILSQDKSGGALNYYNYMPIGSIGIERHNFNGADESNWISISISTQSETKIVYETKMPYLTADYMDPGSIDVVMYNVTINVPTTFNFNLTFRSVNGFSMPLNLELGDVGDGLVCEMVSGNGLYAIDANSEITIPVSLKVTGQISGFHIICMTMTSSQTYRGNAEVWVQIEVIE